MVIWVMISHDESFHRNGKYIELKKKMTIKTSAITSKSGKNYLVSFE